MSASVQTLLKLSDRCVLCGLCLPHCPTYRHYGCEIDSPRGRITLIQSLLREEIPLTADALQPLQRCLLCTSCEAFCPSQVEYSRLLLLAKERLQPTPPPRRPLLISLLLASRSRPWLTHHLLTLYRHSGVATVVGQSSALSAQFRHYARRLQRRLRTSPRPSSDRSLSPPPQILLLKGCLGEAFDCTTLNDATTLLRHLGYRVLFLKEESCCGTIHRHQGDIQQAEALQQALAQQIEQQEADTVLYSVGGCSHQYQNLPTSRSVSELVTFLAHHFRERELRGMPPLSPLPYTIALHQPCSSRNQLHNTDDLRYLLQLIPQLKVELLPSNNFCCGAAGTHMVSDPQSAAAYRQPHLEAIATIAPDIVVTPNLGCALHLEQALAPGIELLHPVSLLCRALTIGNDP
ncbi:MAG: (Fe-S)-binding protein [Gammaproteobacteria bacterium]|nr:(Fe-S)-binding protein [Gammaproteobacteria bacterium]